MKKILFLLLLSPLLLSAQNLREQLQRCPVVIENGKINYYMPQQQGAYFQLPPARKPWYVNIMHVPWVAPLTKPVDETQNNLLSGLAVQTNQTNLSTEDKSLFLRKLAWCVMLHTAKAKEIDKKLINFARQISDDNDITISSQAKLVVKLVEDYGGIK